MKKLKIYYAFITVIASMLFFSACPGNESEPLLIASPSKLTFTAEDKGEQIITITTDATWNYSVSAGWIDAYRKSDDKLYVTVSKNEDTNDGRSATITFIAGSKKKATADVAVEQQKLIKNNLSVNPTELSFKHNETGGKTVQISTDAASWDFTKTADWLSVSKQNNTLSVSISATYAGNSDRSTEIVITAGNANPVTIPVSQSAQNTLDVSPSELNFASTATSSKQVTITTNAPDWEYNTKETWLTVSKSGNTLNVSPKTTNIYTSILRATITITAGTANEKNITVQQEGRNTLTVNPDNLTFEATDTNAQSVSINTNASSWNYNVSASWMTISKSGNTLSVRPTTANTSSTALTATITISAGTASDQTITVRHNGQSAPSLTVSTTSLVFGATETSNKTVTVTTTASSWECSIPVSWLTYSKSGNSLYIRPSSQNTTATTRSATVKVTAGTAERTITVTQYSQPIYSNSSYSATSVLLQDNPSYNNSSWTGQIQAFNTATTPYIAITGFGGSSRTIFCDFVGSSYRLDITTKVVDDVDGIHEGYLCMGTVNASTGNVQFHTGVNFNVVYNPTTRILDFSSTYNGLPTFITVVPKNKNTGQWDIGSYYFNVYHNLKIQLNSTTSAPQLGNSENENAKGFIFNGPKVSNESTRIKFDPKMLKIK